MKRRKLFQKERVAEYDYIVSREQPLSFVAEAFQKALVNLEYVNVDGNFKVLQFTSSLAGAGKTTFVSNLSYLIGKKGKRVVLVDLDLRKPKINRIFKAPNENGVTDYLAGKIEYKDLVKYSEKLNTYYVVAGERTTAVVNILEAQKLKDLVQRLREEFDYVILDSPPVIAVSDALYIARLADGVIFVVAQNEARKAVINEAISTLKQNNVNIIGTVFTQVDIKENELYSYTYGYGYGYNSNKEETPEEGE
ncbi:CpsD/CapB family tyrosine-protein kinase [Acholeplasma equirhinis]|uniref:CpsD/CapB family tyrosine-protein kinase n=1 Tax=Acholeplasma equirhinis TaxID=555393 RepID=UPI00197AF587|nr:CpsD/CapB family tyrosine-protein kinase [Acholeplasma equirhinis]MBN3489991.1 CpsD/CapB family tyrosine-protein kinase [Acholeplasma equirhinis]